MSDSQDPKQQQAEHGAFWKNIVQPTARGLESFFWNLAWFLVLIFILFSFNPFR